MCIKAEHEIDRFRPSDIVDVIVLDDAFVEGCRDHNNKRHDGFLLSQLKLADCSGIHQDVPKQVGDVLEDWVSSFQPTSFVAHMEQWLTSHSFCGALRAVSKSIHEFAATAHGDTPIPNKNRR